MTNMWVRVTRAVSSRYYAVLLPLVGGTATRLQRLTSRMELWSFLPRGEKRFLRGRSDGRNWVLRLSAILTILCVVLLIAFGRGIDPWDLVVSTLLPLI